MRHIIIDIRYSLLMENMTGKGNWKIGRGTTDEEYKKTLFNSERLRSRENVFERYTLKSLQNIYNNLPKDVILQVNILASIDLPAINKLFLQKISEDNCFIDVKFYDSASANTTKAFTEYIQQSVGWMEMYASVRLDDDDMLSIHWLNKINSLLNPLFNNMVISLSGGYAVQLNDENDIQLVSDFRWICPSAGLTYINQKNSSSNKSIYECGAHNSVDERFLTVLDSSEKFLIRTYSKNNDSQDPFPIRKLLDIDLAEVLRPFQDNNEY